MTAQPINTCSIQGGRIKAQFADGARWDVALSDIVLVGEYSTQEGPWADDHFYCVIDKEGTRYDVGDEEGASLFLDQLSSALGVCLTPKLILSTDFASCILYPLQAYGQPLFVLPLRPQTVFEKVKSLFASGEHDLRLSEVAKTLIPTADFTSARKAQPSPCNATSNRPEL